MWTFSVGVVGEQLWSNAIAAWHSSVVVFCRCCKQFPVIELVGNVPDPVKKTLSLFETVCTSLLCSFLLVVTFAVKGMFHRAFVGLSVCYQDHLKSWWISIKLLDSCNVWLAWTGDDADHVVLVLVLQLFWQRFVLVLLFYFFSTTNYRCRITLFSALYSVYHENLWIWFFYYFGLGIKKIPDLLWFCSYL